MNKIKNNWKTLVAFALCSLIMGACIGAATKMFMNQKQEPSYGQMQLEARKQVGSLSETKEIFTISTIGEDARIIRFTAVDGEDPELILETTLEMKELLRQLIEIGF